MWDLYIKPEKKKLIIHQELTKIKFNFTHCHKMLLHLALNIEP